MRYFWLIRGRENLPPSYPLYLMLYLHSVMPHREQKKYDPSLQQFSCFSNLWPVKKHLIVVIAEILISYHSLLALLLA